MPRFQCVLNETSDRYREQDATGKNVVRLLLLRRLAVAALSLFPFSLCNRNCVFGFFLLPPFFFLCPNMQTCLYVVLGRATYNNTVCDCTIFVRNLSVPALTSLYVSFAELFCHFRQQFPIADSQKKNDLGFPRHSRTIHFFVLFYGSNSIRRCAPHSSVDQIFPEHFTWNRQIFLLFVDHIDHVNYYYERRDLWRAVAHKGVYHSEHNAKKMEIKQQSRIWSHNNRLCNLLHCCGDGMAIHFMRVLCSMSSASTHNMCLLLYLFIFFFFASILLVSNAMCPHR